MKSVWLAVLVIAIACSSHSIPPKPLPAASRTLVLTVRDANGPVSGAIVKWRQSSATTDASGRMTGVIGSAAYVTIRAANRATQKIDLDVHTPTATIERTITLAPGARVEGVVLDPAGRPYADAVVHFRAGGLLAETAHTDPSGRWSIDGVGAGHHEVTAWAPPFANHPPRQIIETDGRHALSSVVVHLSAGATITGTVVDRTGAPVPNAKIDYDWNTEYADAHGRFTCTALIAGDHTLYAVRGKAVSKAQKVVVAENGHATVQLVIDGSHTISGTVTGPDGKGIAAGVVASGTDTSVMVSTTADRAGRYSLVAPPGKYRINARHESGYSPPRDASTGDRVDLEIPRRPTITGRVVAGGQPVPYFGVARVSYIPRVQRPADGRFALTDYVPGTFDFVIVAPGFVPHLRKGVVVVAGRTVDLGDIVLERGRTLRGRVVDARGAGVANATVQLSVDNDFTPPTTLDDLAEGHIAVVTDATGRYAITGIDPAIDHFARVEAGLGDLRSSRRPLARTDDGVVLTLGPTGELAGVLVPPPDRYTRSTVTATAVANPTIVYQVETTSTGDFRIGRVPPGAYDVATLGGGSQRITIIAGTLAKATLAAP